MRKLLGLLVAAVFVATASSSAMAITLSTLGDKGTYKAEVVFTVSGNFGFVLKKAGDTAMPVYATDASTGTIDWLKINGTDFLTGVAAGAAGFKNSHVYALVENDLAPGTSVQFYTDNQNAPVASKYKPAVANQPLVESMGGAATANPGLPLAYVLIDEELLTSTVAPVKKNGANAAPVNGTLTNVDDIFFMDRNAGNTANIESIYTWWLADKSSTTYTKVKGTIALNNATQHGNRIVAKGPADNPLPGTPTGEYWYKPATRAYMFFSTNFTDALGGYSYGSDMVTLEMTVDGSY